VAAGSGVAGRGGGVAVDFGWDEQQEQLRDAVEAFARRDLDDDLVGRDADGEFRRELWNRCARFGIPGLPIPPEYGGQGADALTTMLALEALGHACRDNGLIFSLNAHMWSAAMPILRFGSDEQRKTYLPPLCDGTLIGVQGMTEPGTGSDAFALRTTATQTDGGYRLRGSKTFITNAPIADVFVIFASTAPAMGAMGLSAFLIERQTPGLDVGRPFEKMGLRTSPMSELFFDDCEVPAEAMLGRPGNGMTIFNHSIDWERACILASAVGTMQRQVEESVAYANERVQFGQAIGRFQAVSHRIADMQVRVEAARMLLYRAGWAKQQGERAPAMASAIAKLYISEAWVQNSLDALQVRGGSGYLVESEVERDVRDALASRIYSGTSDIQRNIIASRLGL
jgi:alkylation response protein AidB-like acyl-CoA dehydrogenase